MTPSRPIVIVLACFLGIGLVPLTTFQAPDQRVPLPLPGQQPAKSPQERIKERDRLREAAHQAEVAGKLDQATEQAKQALAIDRALHAAATPDLIPGLELLARLHELRDSWEEARQLRKEVVTIREKTRGRNHWETRDAQIALSFVDTLAAFPSDVLRLVREADRLHGNGVDRFQEQQYHEAAKLFRIALDRKEKTLGTQHLSTIRTEWGLGKSLSDGGDSEAGLKHLERALAASGKALGDVHPVTAQIMQHTAEAHQALNNPAAATALYKKLLDVRMDLGEFDSVVRLDTLRKLAVTARAARDFRTAAEARQRLLPSLQANDFWDRFEDVRTAHKEERDALRSGGELASRLVEIAEYQDEFYWYLISSGRKNRAYTAASRIESAVVDLWTEVHGREHWRTTDSRASKARFDRLAELPRAKQDFFEEADAIGDGVKHQLLDQGAAIAITKALTHLQIRKDLLGETDPDYSKSLSILGLLYRSIGDFESARLYLAKALEVRRRLLGEMHPQTAISLNNLGQLHYQAGESARALVCLRQAMAILEKQLDHRHPAYRAALNNLAVVYQTMGDHVRARELLREAYETFRQDTRDPEDVRRRRAISLNALTMSLSGDANWSGNLYLRGVFSAPFFDDKLEQARLLNNLARVDLVAGSLQAAVQLLTEAREIHEALPSKPFGGVREEYVACLNNLALAHILQKEFDQARPLLDRSLELRKKEFGPARPEYATGLTSLAFLHAAEGRFQAARGALTEAAAILKQTPGEKSQPYANVLGNLALIDTAERKLTDALGRLEVVLRISVEQLASSSAVQSEREQFARLQQLRGHLDAYLAAAIRAKHDPAATYASVLTWKGSVFARQRRIRERVLLAEQGQGEANRLLAALEGLARQLAAKSKADARHPTPTAQQELADLERQMEALEQQLAAASAEVRSRKAAEATTPAQLRAALPKDAVLLDFLEYSLPAIDPTAKRERRLAVFVVRREGPVVVLDLGPVGPVAEAVDKWRQTIDRRHPVRDVADPAVVLRERVWEPIASHLDGAKLVLVSPDGALGKLPFAALPGKDRDTYLIEEVTLVTLPVPQELPRLSADPARGRFADEPTLLLVGDVDFNAGIAQEARGAGRWTSLPGTRGEMLGVRDTFEQRYPFPDGHVRVLRGNEATEAQFREQAPRHRWLHLGTHGYFDRPGGGSDLRDTENRQAFADTEGGSGTHPGVLSGLVLAGANAPLSPGGDDGILSALEIAALNLNGVEVAVLSACETGLGTETGGEGLLGLQRAFQTAGVRTVVASLWPVSDDPTRQLMEQFYVNLWQKDLPPAEALRQAQLKLLEEGPLRGMVFKETDVEKGRRPRVPPRYWAAFTLSGGWDAGQEKPPPASGKAVVLRPRLVNANDPGDETLERQLERSLRLAGTTTGPAPEPALVYAPTAQEYPGAVRPTGTYAVDGKAVTVRLVLKRDGKEVGRAEVRGTTDDLAALADKLMNEVRAAARP